MYFDVPTVTRCCFCLPLRFGLIGYGYLKLILMIGGIFYEYDSLLYSATQSVLGAFVLAALLVDFILTVTFVIGGHIKNVLLLNIFMWYMVFTTAAQVALTAYVVIKIHSNNPGLRFENYYNMIVTTTASVCLELFLIFSIRSEIVKRQDKARESVAVQYQMGGETIRVKPELRV